MGLRAGRRSDGPAPDEVGLSSLMEKRMNTAGAAVAVEAVAEVGAASREGELRGGRDEGGSCDAGTVGSGHIPGRQTQKREERKM